MSVQEDGTIRLLRAYLIHIRAEHLGVVGELPYIHPGSPRLAMTNMVESIHGVVLCNHMIDKIRISAGVLSQPVYDDDAGLRCSIGKPGLMVDASVIDTRKETVLMPHSSSDSPTASSMHQPLARSTARLQSPSSVS